MPRTRGCPVTIHRSPTQSNRRSENKRPSGGGGGGGGGSSAVKYSVLRASHFLALRRRWSNEVDHARNAPTADRRALFGATGADLLAPFRFLVAIATCVCFVFQGSNTCHIPHLQRTSVDTFTSNYLYDCTVLVLECAVGQRTAVAVYVSVQILRQLLLHSRTPGSKASLARAANRVPVGRLPGMLMAVNVNVNVNVVPHNTTSGTYTHTPTSPF